MSIYAVFCTADIPIETLNTLFSSLPATPAFYLVTSLEPLAQAPTPTEAPIEPFSRPPADSGWTKKAQVVHPSLSKEAVILLDAQTARDGTTLAIEFNSPYHTAPVHCSFDTAPRALERLVAREVTLEALQNVAALEGGQMRGGLGDGDGGKWETALDDEEAVVNSCTGELLDRVQRIRALNQGKEDWKTYDSEFARNYAVFVTADIRAKFLSRLLDMFYDFDGYTDEDGPFAHFVDSTDVEVLKSSPSKPPVAAFTRNPFLGVPFPVINGFVKRNFPGHGLSSRFYIILDEYTVKDETCIAVDTRGWLWLSKEPRLSLLRLGMSTGFLEIVASDHGNLTVDGSIQAAQRQGGVLRHEISPLVHY